jgi:hypothetical protein
MRLALCLLLTACSLPYGDDTTEPPVTGATHRYVVDAIALPHTNTEARAMGGDLNGDRTADNQLGMVISTLNSQGDVTTHGSDMIAAGAIASSFEIIADDLTNDGLVAVTYHGEDADAAVAVRGALTDGWFRSTRNTAALSSGRAIARIPVYVDADPTVLEIEHLEIDLQPDGVGGFDGYVRGAVAFEAARHAAFIGARQMIETAPRDHILFMWLMDAMPHDWVMTEDEWNKNSLVVSLFEPDVTLAKSAMLSIGFRVHLSPCEGACELPPVRDRCHDRVRDQDETGVDCGGSTCRACAIESPTCSDGIQDGFETEIDCGANCNGCALGDACYEDDDCPSGSTCGAPCTSTICVPHLDTCR